MGRVSRLWSRLGLKNNLIRVWSEADPALNLNDSNIKAITINRGSGTVGDQDHTMELDTATNRGLLTGQPIHCDLTNSGRDRIVALTGAPTNIKPRFFGRVGRQTINDAGGRDGSQWQTSFYCSKWQSQLMNSDRVGNQINGHPVTYLMDHFLNPTIDTSYLPYMPPATFSSPSADYGTMINDYDLGTAKIPYSEFATKYLADPGYYMQNSRAGADRVMTLKYRWENAKSRMATWYPLTRSQVISPAQWGQPNENVARNHKVSWLDSGGLKSYIAGPDPSDMRIPVVDHDLSYIRYADEFQPIHLATVAYGGERTDSGWKIPTVDIDLLRLIDSPVYAHRAQARQLLQMEMGDPVFLSGDWYYALTGIHYATGITEKITPDGWTISLDLEPSVVAVGEWSPSVPARTWESATYPWNDATGTWDQA